MNPTPRQSVLLIEDDPQHRLQITERLQRAEFDVQSFAAAQLDAILNYKALDRNTQIVVVDLDLGTGAGATAALDNGKAFAMNELWPLDRSTVFVVFSQHIQSSGNMFRRLNDFEPQIAYVPKVVAAGIGITADSLDNLAVVLAQARYLVFPAIEQVVYSSHEYRRPIEEFLAWSGNKSYYSPVLEAITSSVKVLNRLGREAFQYARAGQVAEKVVIAVYGSCGRLEMRPSSDVEFSVYVDDGEDSVLKLALTCWNRLSMFCEAHGLTPEGIDLIANNTPRILLLNQIGDVGRNSYKPIFLTEELLETQLNKVQNVRNRLFQMFVEGRSVFNSRRYSELKLELFRLHSRVVTTDTLSAFGCEFWRELLLQFRLDTSKTGILTLKDVKTFCYRTMGLIGMQLALITQIEFSESDSGKEPAWPAVFERLSEPAIVKIVRFANDCKKAKLDGLATVSQSIADQYASLIGRLRLHIPIAEQQPDAVEQFVREASQEIQAISGSCSELKAAIRANEHLARTRQRGWLTEWKRPGNARLFMGSLRTLMPQEEHPEDSPTTSPSESDSSDSAGA